MVEGKCDLGLENPDRQLPDKSTFEFDNKMLDA
jgi:hypothetical protein